VAAVEGGREDGEVAARDAVATESGLKETPRSVCVQVGDTGWRRVSCRGGNREWGKKMAGVAAAMVAA
jgi:hypothetical protein